VLQQIFDHLVGTREQRRPNIHTELFIASGTYWIKFAHTAQYKTAAQTIAINTNQIAILPNLGTSR